MAGYRNIEVIDRPEYPWWIDADEHELANINHLVACWNAIETFCDGDPNKVRQMKEALDEYHSKDLKWD